LTSRRTTLKKVLHNRHITGLLYAGSMLAFVELVGTLGYHYLGRPAATWIDSFYMTFLTISTIGFEEVIDLSDHPFGRLFTVFIAVFGIATVSYLFSTMVAFLVDSDLNIAMRRRRMDKDIAEMRGHYIICGIGRVGSNVAHELAMTKRSFVVIESERAALDAWLEHHPDTLYLHDDAADDEALQRAGVTNAAGVFAVTGDDSHNLMVALSVKLLKPAVRVVVRLHDIRNEKKARRAGADEIVSPDFTGGMRIASAMVRPHVVNFMDQMLHSEDVMRMEEVAVPANFSLTSVGELMPKSKDYVLMATHEQGRWMFNPEDNHQVKPGIVLVVMANPQGRQRVEASVASRCHA
jgi:voltage-gated potassium channel